MKLLRQLQIRTIDRPKQPKMFPPKSDSPWDTDIEAALMSTLGTTKAIRLPLVRFHSSPVKGRLWKKGFKVRHRVIGLRTVAAWLLPEVDPSAEII